MKHSRVVCGLVAALAFFPFHSAFALEAATPGKSMEGIRLGMTRNAACKVILDRNKYGAKWVHSEVFRLGGGLVEDDLEMREPGISTFTISVLSKKGIVIQVSRTTSDDSHQTDYSFAKLKRDHPLQEKSFDFFRPGEGGTEGYYFDDIKRGVCFACMTQETLFLTSKPTTMIVHKPNAAVIPALDGMIGERDNGPSGRIYKNSKDYDNQAEHDRNGY